MRAAEIGDVARAELLLAHPKMNLDQISSEPLVIAARKGFPEMVKLFLNHSAIDVNGEDSDGMTALGIASSVRELEGLTWRLRTLRCLTPQCLMEGSDEPKLSRYWRRWEIVGLLLNHPKIDVNRRSAPS